VSSSATTDAPVVPFTARVVRVDLALMRVVAIVAVVSAHVAGLTRVNADLHGTQVWWVAQAVYTGVRCWCVPLFVMVSGALLLRPGTRETAGAFYRRRARRLLPALVFWYVAYGLFTRYVLDQPTSPGRALSLALTGRTYSALYFFWVILGLYLVTPALRKVVVDLVPRDLLRLGLVLTAAMAGWAATGAFVASHSDLDVVAESTAFTYWVPWVGYFVLGAALAERRVARRWAAPLALVFIGTAAVCAWLTSTSGPTPLRWVSPDTFFGVVTAVSSAAAFLLFTSLLPPTRRAPGPGGRVLGTLGGLTLGVFAMHLAVLYGLQHASVVEVPHGATTLPELGYLLWATLLLSFCAAWALSHVPLLRHLV
jgi:surface polysaccharide O-acyltransferase-like enzyme